MQNGQQQTLVSQGDPPLDKPQQADHSLSADLAMGWRPKLKVIGPIPLNFDNQFMDKAIKDLLKSQASIYSVVYLGPRPQNTFKMHEVLKKKYKYKYQHLFSVQYGHLKAFFHNFYSQFEPKMKTPFLGMNPMYKSHKLTFDSCFESGNLDCAIKVNENQYDLVLRIDSNTAGHIMWYYFKVTCNEKTTQTIKFNVINLRRNKSCYQRGMKPFIRRRKRTQQIQNSQDGWSSWQQGGRNVQVDEQKIRFTKQNFVFEHGMVGMEETPMLFRRLTFAVELEPFEEVEFAYCVPYNYSDLTNDLKLLKQTIIEQNTKNIHFQLDMNNESLSGLEIPVLKITEKEEEKYDEEKEKNKFCVYIIGRQHPGESNGSYTMKGMLQQLVKNTPELTFLRKHIVFKIIPMLNVDGVVMGNFRTSLYGKDLNRLFKKQQLFLIPEVQMCKDIFNELVKIHKKKFMMFLDIHGHSARRNAFCYGPGILDANAFSDVRQFAKIIASRTEIFRYPSCSFRIDSDKKTTARACFSKSVGLGYTIESSNWSFYSRSQAKMIDFTKKEWEEVGFHLIESLHEYAEEKIMKNLAKKKKKNQNQGKGFDKKNPNQQEFSQKQSPRKTDKNQISLATDKILRKTSNQRQSLSRTKTMKSQTLQNNSETEYDMASKKQINRVMNEIQEAQNESDKMSDNEMDSDSEGEDMDKNKFEKYMNGAKRMMIEFEKVYFGDDYEKKGKTAAKLRNQAKKLMKENSSKNIKKNSQILACMRKKQPNPQSSEFQSKMIDIAGKIKLQPRKISTNNNTATLNTKVIQFESPQVEEDSKQMMQLSQKSSFQRVVLPRIQESYQLKRRQEYGEKGVSPSRIEEWSQPNETPQLMMVDEERYVNHQDEEAFYAVKQRIRQKSITNYQHKSLYHLVEGSFLQKKTPFDTVQSKQFMDDSSSSSQMNPDSDRESSDEEPSSKVLRWNQREDMRRYSGLNKNYDNEGQISSIRQIKQNLRYNILQGKFQNQPEQPQNQVLLHILSQTGRKQAQTKLVESPKKNIRFSMKSQAMNHTPTRSSGIIKNARQLSQMKKKQLLEKLSDPASLGYGNGRNQIISSQDLGGIKDKKNLISFEFHNINYGRHEPGSHENAEAHKNHQKIQEIILNNLQLMKGNPNKSNVRSKRQKMKEPYMVEDQKQKFSIDAVPIGKKLALNDQPDKPSSNKKTSLRMEQNQDPSQNNKLLQPSTNEQQQMTSASVMLPRNNVHQLDNMKTVESQNLTKLQKPEGINHKKIAKGSATRNYSQRHSERQFDLLREEQKINRKVMKFGRESLPKITNERSNKINSPHQYSKTNINLKKNIQKSQRQSPRKTQKPLINSISPQTDYKNIKLICVNEKISKEMDDEKMQKEVRLYEEVIHSDEIRRNNKQRLLNRLKQLEREEKEKFGEQNLVMNQKLVDKDKREQQSFRRYGSSKDKQEQMKSKELFYFDTTQGARMKTNESQGNKEKPITKQTQIFVLPQGFSKSSYIK